LKRTIRLKEFTPNSRLVHVPQDWYLAARDPVLQREEFVMHTDANGFIKSSSHPTAPSQIIVLGDSVVEGMFVREPNRVCAELEALLRDRLGTAISVLNGGYSGATLLHTFNVMLNKVIPLRPQLVVIMSGFVDVDVGKLSCSFWSQDCWLEPIVDLHTPNTKRDTSYREAADYADRERLGRLLIETGRLFDVPICFATVPHRIHYKGEYVRRSGVSRIDFDRNVAVRRQVNTQVRRLALTTGTPLLDIEIALIGQDDLFYDEFHIHSSAGRVVAQAMMDEGLPTLIGDKSNGQTR
jgi:hypothetical protein